MITVTVVLCTAVAVSFGVRVAFLGWRDAARATARDVVTTGLSMAMLWLALSLLGRGSSSGPVAHREMVLEGHDLTTGDVVAALACVVEEGGSPEECQTRRAPGQQGVDAPAL